MTSMTKDRFVAPALAWKQAADDIHVATENGEFAGFIEAHSHSWLVRDRTGTVLGTFPILAEARSALERAAA